MTKEIKVFQHWNQAEDQQVVELAAEVVEAHGVAVEVAHPEDEETRIDGAPVLLFLWLFLLLMSEHLMRNNLCVVSPFRQEGMLRLWK